MPILGQEQPIMFSMEEVFNPTTANMLLQAQQNYGNILRQEYKDSMDELKEFNKLYGDFISQSGPDTQNYYDATLLGAGDLYDAMLAQGIDPLRSVEGRQQIRKYIATRPYAQIANFKQAAKNMEEFVKNRDAAIASGKYSPEFFKFLYGDIDPSTWDTSKKGIWKVTQIPEFKDLNQWTSHLFDNMEWDFDDEASKATGGKYDVYSKSRKKMEDILSKSLKDLLSTDLGKFYQSIYGDDLSNEIINRNLERVAVKRDANEYYKMDKAFGQQVSLERMKHANAMELAKLRGELKRNTGVSVWDQARHSDNKIGTYQNKFWEDEGVYAKQDGFFRSDDGEGFEFGGSDKARYYLLDTDAKGNHKENSLAVVTIPNNKAKGMYFRSTGEIKYYKKKYFNKVDIQEAVDSVNDKGQPTKEWKSTGFGYIEVTDPSVGHNNKRKYWRDKQ